jgi:hypothetical protein
MMATKKFDKKLYDKANPLSNGIMVKWLDKNGYQDIDPKETYGVDITCQKGDTPAFFETEIKYSWVNDWSNDWKEIRIPYRKHKIIDKWVQSGSEGSLTFIVFRGDCKMAWFIDGQDVRDAKVAAINNRYMSNEKFYHIDVNDANLINMESLANTDEFINSKYPA